MGYQDRSPRRIGRRSLLRGGAAVGLLALRIKPANADSPLAPNPEAPRPISIPYTPVDLKLTLLPQGEMLINNKGDLDSLYPDNASWKFPMDQEGSIIAVRGDNVGIDAVQQETHTKKPTFTVYIAEIIDPRTNLPKNQIAAVLVPRIPPDADVVYKRYTREASQPQNFIAPSDNQPAEAQR